MDADDHFRRLAFGIGLHILAKFIEFAFAETDQQGECDHTDQDNRAATDAGPGPAR